MFRYYGWAADGIPKTRKLLSRPGGKCIGFTNLYGGFFFTFRRVELYWFYRRIYLLFDIFFFISYPLRISTVKKKKRTKTGTSAAITVFSIFDFDFFFFSLPRCN